MNIDPRAWRWTCPHCRKGAMKLESGKKHILRHHFDCGSCRIEMHMLNAMMQGKGFIVEGPMPFDHMPSRA